MNLLGLNRTVEVLKAGSVGRAEPKPWRLNRTVEVLKDEIAKLKTGSRAV